MDRAGRGRLVLLAANFNKYPRYPPAWPGPATRDPSRGWMHAVLRWWSVRILLDKEARRVTGLWYEILGQRHYCDGGEREEQDGEGYAYIQVRGRHLRYKLEDRTAWECNNSMVCGEIPVPVDGCIEVLHYSLL